MLMVILFFSSRAAGQYFLAESYLVVPGTIIIEQYEKLPPEIVPQLNMTWDLKNNYTRIYVLRNNEQEVFHVLVQTDLMGAPTFIGLSKNISSAGLHNVRTMYMFQHCLHEELLPRLPDDRLVAWLDCIVHWLNDFK